MNDSIAYSISSSRPLAHSTCLICLSLVTLAVVTSTHSSEHPSYSEKAKKICHSAMIRFSSLYFFSEEHNSTATSCSPQTISFEFGTACEKLNFVIDY